MLQIVWHSIAYNLFLYSGGKVNTETSQSNFASLQIFLWACAKNETE